MTLVDFWWNVVAVLVALGLRDIATSLLKWRRKRAIRLGH